MERIHTRLREVIDFVSPLLPLANSHMVNFITQKLWDTFVPNEMKNEVENGEIEEILDLFWGKTDVQARYDFICRFLKDSGAMSVRLNDGISMDMKDLSEKIRDWAQTFHHPLHYEPFMSSKKSHEVEMMSFLVATLASFTSATHCVDIGGGKGYLSSILALEYKLKVLGLDSCNIKTFGAANRVSKLKKVWQGTRKKIDVPTAEDKNDGSVGEEEDGTKNEDDALRPDLLYKQETEFVSDRTDLLALTKKAFPEDSDCRLGLTGLHTCGDLAPACLKQFAKNSDSIEYLVNVGCCHHLLTEGSALQSENGFPLSRFLRDQRFTLGRNARMLSLLAQSRIQSSRKVPIDSLLYRAVLQKLLLDKLGCDNVPKGQVGRVAEKCANFAEYVHKALDKLNISSIDITDEEAQEFYAKHEYWKTQLLIFFMLRVSLAPVLENIILLDRLLFLKEQGIEHSYLIKMFDPVLSPRCYGIVALRDRNSCLQV